jgi:hypothetical protein
VPTLLEPAQSRDISAVVRENATQEVSLIIPTYNRAHLVTRRINWVLTAISPGNEVVPDDRSMDQTDSALVRPLELFGRPTEQGVDFV